NENLTPLDAVKFAAAYGSWLKEYSRKGKLTVVVGRDARISGEMIQNLVVSTLVGLGIDVIDMGLSTTPTVEIAVPLEKADGGIILTASHNPKQWNALKLLNEKGEFLDAIQGAKILELAEKENFEFAQVDQLGQVTTNDSYIDIHVDEVLDLALVDAETIKKAGFKVVVDGVNSTGGIAIPKLLAELAVGAVNVVGTMRADNAVIGSEGDGGIIYPESQYGRDAPVGTALFLMLLAERGGTVAELRASYPTYFMGKKKIQLTPGLYVDAILE